MFIVTLEEYPHRKRWMRGTVVKEMSIREIKGIHFFDELDEIIKHWCSHYFDVYRSNVHIENVFCISSRKSELRIQQFFYSLRMYDLRIIHLRLHKRYSEKLIKLKISFKRQGHKYYDTLKLLTRINID